LYVTAVATLSGVCGHGRRADSGRASRHEEATSESAAPILPEVVEAEAVTADGLVCLDDAALHHQRTGGIDTATRSVLNPHVWSVASLFISRWDKAVLDKVPEPLRDQLGIAIARRTYKAYRELLDSPRWLRLLNEGARPQRLLWASTGTKDPKASDVLYLQALAAPFTIATVPEATLRAFADHGRVSDLLPPDGGNCEEVLGRFRRAGIDIDALAVQLQREGAEEFDKSWNDLLECIASKSEALKKAS
jgi:transaldolase